MSLSCACRCGGARCCTRRVCSRSSFSGISVAAPSSISNSDVAAETAIASSTESAQPLAPRADAEAAPAPHDAAGAATAAEQAERRLPVAFLAALGILLVIELVVRAMPLQAMV